MDDGRTILCCSANLVFLLLMPAHLSLYDIKELLQKQRQSIQISYTL